MYGGLTFPFESPIQNYSTNRSMYVRGPSESTNNIGVTPLASLGRCPQRTAPYSQQAPARGDRKAKTQAPYVPHPPSSFATPKCEKIRVPQAPSLPRRSACSRCCSSSPQASLPIATWPEARWTLPSPCDKQTKTKVRHEVNMHFYVRRVHRSN